MIIQAVFMTIQFFLLLKFLPILGQILLLDFNNFIDVLTQLNEQKLLWVKISTSNYLTQLFDSQTATQLFDSKLYCIKNPQRETVPLQISDMGKKDIISPSILIFAPIKG